MPVVKTSAAFQRLKIAQREVLEAAQQLEQDFFSQELTIDKCIEFLCKNLSNISDEQHSHLLDRLL